MTSSLLLCLVVAAGPRPSAGPGSDDNWLIRRVGGDPGITTEFKVDRYVSGESFIESPLPDGYPRPTAPGVVELKRYPSVRRAEVSGERDPDQGRDGAFRSLFQHIKERDIAMTSPVEMDYDTLREGSWTMSFLYRSTDLGPSGGDGAVRVVDTEPVTVVAVGIRGAYGRNTVDRGLLRLEEWLDSQNEWERAGALRALYYNGPYVAEDRKWAEVQIPVRRVSAAVDRSMPSERTLSPGDLIELAVRRGAPLFNDHQPEACRAIYEVTIEWLLATSPQLDSELEAMLRKTLDDMRRQDDPRTQAWTLRHALDTVYRSLAGSTAASGR